MAGADDDVLREAADPETALERLAEIAYRHPGARAAVAANPSTYPDLLTWLGDLGDSDVDSALASRQSGAADARAAGDDGGDSSPDRWDDEGETRPAAVDRDDATPAERVPSAPTATLPRDTAAGVHYAPAVPTMQSAQPGSGRRVALVVGVAIGVVALIVFAAVVIPRLTSDVVPDAGPPATEAPLESQHARESANSLDSQVASNDQAACDGELRGEVRSVTVADDGDLDVGLAVFSDCPNGRLVDTARLEVSLASGDSVAADAFVDLSSTPMQLGVEGAELDVRFRPGSYWVADDVLPSDLIAQLSELEPSPQASGSAPSGSVAVTGVAALSEEAGQERALEQLKRQAAADRRVLESSDAGSWVPQLSSMKVGLRTHGTTLTNQKIWYSFVEFRRTYGAVLLLWSGDWQCFKYKDFWVVVSAESFSDADDANSWCESNGIAREDCYASKITDSEGPEGTSKQR